MLGFSLEDRLQGCGGKFTAPTCVTRWVEIKWIGGVWWCFLGFVVRQLVMFGIFDGISKVLFGIWFGFSSVLVCLFDGICWGLACFLVICCNFWPDYRHLVGIMLFLFLGFWFRQVQPA